MFKTVLIEPDASSSRRTCAVPTLVRLMKRLTPSELVE
jgi:hypothetical protein